MRRPDDAGAVRPRGGRPGAGHAWWAPGPYTAGGFRPSKHTVTTGPQAQEGRRVEDVEEAVARRILTICQLWPGITPHPSGRAGSVWDLTLGMWDLFAAAADDHNKRAKEAQDARR